MEQQYKYFAFISYSSKDIRWGKRLHKKLEYYRMPATLCSDKGWKRKPMAPIFFAPYDIQPGGLSEELQERLRASRNLIVICSPNSAQSEWVGKEIEFFHHLGRTEQIHFFIVDGIPHSGNIDTECFNPVVDTLGLPELLGANIHEKIYRSPWLNKERAYVQLISKLLGVEFDTIWKRHRRLLIRKTLTWIIGIIAVLALMVGIWFNMRSVDVSVRLNEASVRNDSLPPLENARITLMLNNENKDTIIHNLDEEAIFPNIPHRYIGNEVRLKVECKDFLPIDTVFALDQDNVINIYRNPGIYGKFCVMLWNSRLERGVSGIALTVIEQEITTNAEGYATFIVPLERQRTKYQVVSTVPRIDAIIWPMVENDTCLIELE